MACAVVLLSDIVTGNASGDHFLARDKGSAACCRLLLGDLIAGDAVCSVFLLRSVTARDAACCCLLLSHISAQIRYAALSHYVTVGVSVCGSQ